MKTLVIPVGAAIVAGAAIAILIRASTSAPRPAPAAHAGHAMPEKPKPESHSGHGTHASQPDPAPTEPAPTTPPDTLLARLAAAGYRDLGNETCPIMGNASDGDDPTLIAYNGWLVRFCCPGCDGRFLASPREHLKELRAGGDTIPDALLAADAHPDVVRANNTTCPITGAAVDDKSPIVVHRGVVVRVRDTDALVAFAKAPDRGLAEAAKTGTVPADRLSNGGAR